MGYVIIGNSAAGIFAAEAIKQLNNKSGITIISDEKYPAYARCLTSYYLTGKMTENQLFIRPEDFYGKLNIETIFGSKVTKVVPEKKEVHIDNKIIPYNRLLIATGASSQSLEIPGVNLKGVFTLRNLEDAKQIQQYMGPNKSVVIVGGGFVALEAACSLIKAGTKTSCINNMPHVLPQTLDNTSAQVIEEVLTNNGLKLYNNNEAVEILGGTDKEGNQGVTGVKLKSGETIAAHAVIIAIGIKPNTEFLTGSGIKIDTGILVNNFMETNVPDIYAAGDAIEGYDLLYGKLKSNANWPNAGEQGRFAGLNMAGKKVSYEGSINMNTFELFGINCVAAGITNVIKGKDDAYEIYQEKHNKLGYRKFIFQKDRLVGYILICEKITHKTGILTSMIKEKLPLDSNNKLEIIQGIYNQRILW